MGTAPQIVYCVHMNKTQMTETLQDLQDYMFDTMASAEMAVDWYCDRFNVSAIDEESKLSGSLKMYFVSQGHGF